MEKEFYAKGNNGQMYLLGDKVVIERKGVMGFLTQGLKGSKEIHLKNISSIQFKKAGLLTSGYIQIGYMGSQESKSGLFNAANDENTVMYVKKSQDDFTTLKEEIERRMANLESSNNSNNTASLAEELEKLHNLKEKGIISEIEFETQKEKLLNK